MVNWSYAEGEGTEYGFNDLWIPLTGGPIGYQHSLECTQHLRELLPTANTCLNWLEEKEAFKGVLDKLTVEEDIHAKLAEADTLF